MGWNSDNVGFVVCLFWYIIIILLVVIKGDMLINVVVLFVGILKGMCIFVNGFVLIMI